MLRKCCWGMSSKHKCRHLEEQTIKQILSFLTTSARKPSDTLKVPPTPAQLPAAGDSPHVSAQRAGSDRELAMALKVFYQSMNAARGQFLRLRHYKPPVSNQKPGSRRRLSPLNSGV